MKALVLLIITFSLSFVVNADESLSQKVMELRSQVQVESDELDSLKQSLNASIQSLTVEKGELESRKKMLDIQNQEMLKALKEKKKITGGEDVEGFEGLSKDIGEGLVTVADYFNHSIPFKTQERKNKAAKLQEKFNQKDITLAEYTEKYWSLLQDEIRLSQSVELQTDTIDINQKTYQVRVVKIGMYQMYFKTLDGKIGYAKLNNESKWSFKFFEDSKYVKGINMLISAKEKQIKGGTYNLPIAIRPFEVRKGAL